MRGFQLGVLACNLGNLWRRRVTPARYDWLLLAESHLTRRLSGAVLRRIWTLQVPTG